LIGEAVVLAMVCNPPQWPALRGRGANERASKLDSTTNLECPMREAAMVEGGDPEGPNRVRDQCHEERKPAPANEEDPDQREMRDDKRHAESPRPFRSGHRLTGHRIDK
jgi:hypothetical protein